VRIKKGCGKYASFAETGKKAVLAKPPYSTKTWECLARKHKGTEVKPVSGEKQKDKNDFLCGFVA